MQVMKSLIELEALQPTGDLSPVSIKLYLFSYGPFKHILLYLGHVFSSFQKKLWESDTKRVA